MRLFPRINTDLPVAIDEKFAKSKAMISNLSIDGAFIKGHLLSAKVGDTVSMEYHLPGYGLFEHGGRTVRKDTDGIAIKFFDLDINVKVKLWVFIINNLNDIVECPYCGEKYDALPCVCRACGWGLEFNSPGYFEYHEKMYLLKKLRSKADHLEIDQIRRVINFIDVDILKQEASSDFQEFVGTSDAMKEVFSKIRKVAPTDLSVLILGESGTGKDLTAIAIHERSARKEKVFVPINCAAIPESLLEAELFGYEKGAFTGAYTSKMGKFEHGDGGTLFLDEIGELSPGLQAKLLRFIEDQIVERIGGGRRKKVDVRLIAATNCDLESAIAGGRFREDLYYRLDTFTINLPPIRERGEDKVVLAKYFLKRFSSEMGVPKEFNKDSVFAIRNYTWPGNVREIINKVRKAIVMSDYNFITPQDLDLSDRDLSEEGIASLKDYRGKHEKQKVKEVLDSCNSNISKSAKVLGISRPSLYSLKKKYGI